MKTTDKKESARERLIQAGIEAFAENGYNGTTTRMIAEKAECNLAAIPYYFGGKEGLYVAVFEEVSDLPANHLRPNFEDIGSFLAGSDQNPETAFSLLRQLMGDMVDLFCGHPKISKYAQLLIREMLAPTAAFNIFYKKVPDNVMELISKLIQVITGIDDERKATFQAFMMVGQIMSFRNAREVIVRRLGLEGYSEDETAEIRDLVTTWAVTILEPRRCRS